MKEIQFLNIIEKTLSNTDFLGEDCAFLPDLNIFVTQDTLCEDVHFKKIYTDPYTLAQKSVAVNLSDLCANLATPKYISVSLSLQPTFKETCFEKFYKGIEDCCKKYGITVCGGDLTGASDKICVSICAIGTPINKNQPKVSRGYAKENQIVCVTKNYGSSAYGLYCLTNGINCSQEFIDAHNKPEPDIEISKKLATLDCKEIAIMDSSDGLMDALFKIAKMSDKSLEIDFSKIPYNKEIENYKNFKDLILWGGEDYGLVFCVSENDYEKLNDKNIRKIGVVKEKNKDFYVKIDDILITESIFEEKSYNHFKKED